jgi:putative ABC transport system substrate-binding protein
VRLELRWGGYDVDRIATLAKELVDLKPDAILGQTTPVISALARVTRTVPVVFVTVSDPIGSGFAANLAHPGGNITGFSVDDYALGGKWVQLLKEIAPSTKRTALLYSPVGPQLQFFMPSIQAAALSPMDGARRRHRQDNLANRRPGKYRIHYGRLCLRR